MTLNLNDSHKILRGKVEGEWSRDVHIHINKSVCLSMGAVGGQLRWVLQALPAFPTAILASRKLAQRHSGRIILLGEALTLPCIFNMSSRVAYEGEQRLPAPVFTVLRNLRRVTAWCCHRAKSGEAECVSCNTSSASISHLPFLLCLSSVALIGGEQQRAEPKFRSRHQRVPIKINSFQG